MYHLTILYASQLLNAFTQLYSPCPEPLHLTELRLCVARQRPPPSVPI